MTTADVLRAFESHDPCLLISTACLRRFSRRRPLRSSGAPAREKRQAFHQAPAFLDDENAIHRRVAHGVSPPARPAYFEAVHFRRPAQAEVKPQVTRREITASAPHL